MIANSRTVLGVQGRLATLYLSDKRLPYIICGDININRLQHTSSSSVHKYIETYESYICQQIITRPTRVTATSASLIDHFNTTFDLEKVIPGILINDLSDHLLIFLLIKTNTAEMHDKKPIIKRDFTNFDSEMFLETLNHNFQRLPQTEGDPSKDLNQALKVLGDSLNQQAPLKNLSKSKRKLSQKPWITTGLYKSIKNKIKCIELCFEPDSQTQELIIIIRNAEITLIIS